MPESTCANNAQRLGGILFALCLGLAIAAPGSRAAPENSDSDLYAADTGYRIKHYRAPVPADVPGGKTVTLEEVEKLIADGATPLDVMPSTGMSYDPRTGQWRLTEIHDNIPGSIWLPDVGAGRITPELDSYFRENLQRITHGNKGHPLIIYCQSDCWMAWNAVQRAAGYGYQRLYWYPDGIDGWRDWDREFEKANPVSVDVRTD